MLEGVALHVINDDSGDVDELAAVTSELYFLGVFGTDVVSGPRAPGLTEPSGALSQDRSA